jgi:hypothetical protein
VGSSVSRLPRNALSLQAKGQMTYLFRRPSPGEVVGTTQHKRVLSRRHGLAYARDPLGTTRRNARRRVLRRFGYFSFGMRLARFLLRMGR